VPNLTAWGESNDQFVLDQIGQNGNISVDPEFCGVLGSANLYLQSDSPCAAENHDDEPIGAMPVGCGVSSTEETSFSKLKSLY